MASIRTLAHHALVRAARFLIFAVGLLVLIGARGANAAPTPFHLVFNGRHNQSLLHEGTFTTFASWCSSGTAADVGVDSTTETATRRFSCASGDYFTATVRPLPAEHGGSGVRQIVGGSGPFADLRGKGTFTSVLLSGNPNDPATITFRSTWDGVVDHDATPPAVGLTSRSVRKLRRPRGAYSVGLVISLADSGGGAVSYALELSSPRRTFVFKTGTTTTGTLTERYRIKPPHTTRHIRLKIDATDQVGNTSTFIKRIRLR